MFNQLLVIVVRSSSQLRKMWSRSLKSVVLKGRALAIRQLIGLESVHGFYCKKRDPIIPEACVYPTTLFGGSIRMKGLEVLKLKLDLSSLLRENLMLWN
ncbi:hypothetical protein CDAR_71141 [Caerostris darwini]|uniref:Uncharacterized protein n=1 Tax=Caerostris darwini TaxID=1538125 RepID=A0AAV4WF50_9ARAC|nr:hypothetical protein CDAR_71141 [Caerostris darwini]